ncbi:hypothetical protein DXU93_07230 [Brumimicrobium aurantiacum]|uniref:AlgX/AlgJ SGNH hydrolase-like domain-containing protein n=2 Tax=Brumimicrobium aurantiacum TaxID=1737063 RepID=A0A3E1EYY0_9FLAO|nr:hypothetical protein DXU93_07230 [Brumimicrobium aurantiacum]
MMNRMKSTIKYKKGLFIGILGILVFPLFLEFTEMIQLKPLKGSYEIPENPEFTLAQWFTGEYQDEKENFIKKSLYVRPVFVRFYNQYHYSFFNIPKANSIIIGKSSYLFGDNYIKEYFGTNFIGHQKIEEKVNKIQRVADTLKAKGIDLIVVLAPGKASFYPEYLPESYDSMSVGTTNYEVYNQQFLSSNIHYLDFKKWYLDIKETSKYPLFPKTGIHWSKYGELIAADSIIHYINSISPTKKAPELLLGKTKVTSDMWGTDDDIEQGMNLMFDIPDLEMAYPHYEYDTLNKQEQPKVLTVADSYYWGMFNFSLSKKAFDNGEFWFYNIDIFPSEEGKPSFVSEIDIVESVEQNDIVMLVSTDANLFKFPFGFIDRLYEAYYSDQLKAPSE